MTRNILLLLLLFTSCIYSQQNDSIQKYSNYTLAEFQLGNTQESNSGFPKTKLQKALVLQFGNYQHDNDQEWAYRLKYPNTGISFTITDYGNKEYIGYSTTVLPYLEYGMFKRKIDGLKMNIGIGVSHFTNNYDSIPYAFNSYQENTNRAISTKFSWAFKAFFYYDIFKKEQSNWRVGAGYFHQSNGHTKLPNQGMNSFLFSVSRQSNYNFDKRKHTIDTLQEKEYKKSIHSYFTIRTGVGLNVLSEVFNDRKGVYTLAASYGKIINKTFKVGLGFYYRYYEHYNNYIVNEEELVVKQYPYYLENPFKYSTAFGVNLSGELILGHIGTEVNLGYNIYKPFYEIEWKLNQGFYWESIDENDNSELTYILGELDSYYNLKHAISARLGLKYYLINNDKSPKSNMFIAVHINSNLGQADFTELSLGYVHQFRY